jgi:predicted nucleic acid-binding protein
MSERVFVDSSAYYALADPRDDHHTEAVAEQQRLIQAGSELYTTNAVIIETHGLILNRMDRDTAQRVLDRLYASTTRIIRATEGDETRARAIMRQHRDKAYSFTDAISFATMRRFHLKLVWTYDRHFSQFGFTPVQ